MRSKYIIFQEDGEGVKYPIIFPETLQHSSVANSMMNRSMGSFGPHNLKPVSAGFVDINTGEAYGNSVSLNLATHPDDSKFIRNSFGFNL